MRQFILIKQYPGSPELNTIVSQFGIGKYRIGEATEAVERISTVTTLSKGLIEDNPEFWQEFTIVTIVEFTQGKSTKYELRADGNYYSKASSSSPAIKRHQLMNLAGVRISKIRRESDQLEFELGDEMVTPMGSRKIVKFVTKNQGGHYIMAHIEEYEGKVYEVNIIDLLKVKFHVCTSEDNELLYAVDTAYEVNLSKKTVVKIEIIRNASYKHTKLSGRVWFKDIHQAVAYVLNNTQFFSLEQLRPYLTVEVLTALSVILMKNVKVDVQN